MQGRKRDERPMLAVGYNFYEKSLATVQRGIESVKSHVDYIFAIDGRYTDEYGTPLFPDSEPLSHPLVREYLQRIPNVILVDLPANETTKRGKYLSMCQELDCEYLLILDGDEFVLPESDWQSFKHNLEQCKPDCNIYGIKYEYSYPTHHDATNYPRLWFKPWEMEYHGAHCLFKNKVTGVVTKSSSGSPLIEGIRMAGDDSLRSREYQLQSFEYQSFLIEEEREQREKYK